MPTSAARAVAAPVIAIVAVVAIVVMAPGRVGAVTAPVVAIVVAVIVVMAAVSAEDAVAPAVAVVVAVVVMMTAVGAEPVAIIAVVPWRFGTVAAFVVLRWLAVVVSAFTGVPVFFVRAAAGLRFVLMMPGVAVVTRAPARGERKRPTNGDEKKGDYR